MCIGGSAWFTGGLAEGVVQARAAARSKGAPVRAARLLRVASFFSKINIFVALRQPSKQSKKTHDQQAVEVSFFFLKVEILQEGDRKFCKKETGGPPT
jgi:hypothetical protein